MYHFGGQAVARGCNTRRQPRRFSTRMPWSGLRRVWGFMFRRVATLACAAFAGCRIRRSVGLSSVPPQRSPPAPTCTSSAPRAPGSARPPRWLRTTEWAGWSTSRCSELSAQVQQDGRTMTAEAVEYPAVAAPGEDGGVGEWLGFIGSVDAGSAALGKQYEGFVQRCPASKVVLAGYSQGAMVVHRNLEALQASPNLAAVLLVADGDRLPEDPTLNLGTASGIPERGKGAAQDWPILAHAPGPLPPAIGARTISVCNLGDAVCDYNPDDEETRRPTRGAWPSTPATARPRAWTGRPRCTSCSARRRRRPRRSRSFRSRSFRSARAHRRRRGPSDPQPPPRLNKPIPTVMMLQAPNVSDTIVSGRQPRAPSRSVDPPHCPIPLCHRPTRPHDLPSRHCRYAAVLWRSAAILDSAKIARPRTVIHICTADQTPWTTARRYGSKVPDLALI